MKDPKTVDDLNFSGISDTGLEGTLIGQVNGAVKLWPDSNEAYFWMDPPDIDTADTATMTFSVNIAGSNVDFSFSSDSAIDNADSPTNRVRVLSEIAAKINADADLKAVGISAYSGTEGVGLQFSSYYETLDTSNGSSSSSSGGTITNSDYRNIFVRNFDGNNNPSANEVMVNTSAAFSHDNWTDNHGGSIANLSNGGYVVTWTDLSGKDGDLGGVYAQIYDNVGAKVGSYFQVNTTTSGYQWSMSVAGLNDGGFVISWQSPNSSGGRQINGQVFNNSGNNVGSELTFSYVGGNPSVSGFSNGGYVAVWDSGYTNNGVAGTVFDSDYNSVANFTTSGAYLSSPRVTTLTHGNFFVIFEGTNGINGQLFDSSSNKIGGDISIINSSSYNLDYPFVTGIQDGKFVVSFTEEGNLYKKQYDAGGNAEENAT